jgi:hypothetical protein
VINGRWFQDNSTLKVHKGQKGTTKMQNLTVDELTGLPWTGIHNKKNEFIESMRQCSRVQKAIDSSGLIMTQDNAGENKKIEERLHSADWKLQVKMEYTAADTPQQKALVDLKFIYLEAKARAAIHSAGVPREWSLDFFPEVIMTTTKLDWLKLVTINSIKNQDRALWSTPSQICPVSTYMGRSRNRQNRERQENRGPRSHMYVCRLPLQS